MLHLISIYRRVCIVTFAFVIGCSVHAAENTDQTSEAFRQTVYPILQNRCFKCHSHTAEKLKANLFLDSRSGMLIGGDSGAAVVPGRPDESRLIEAIHYGNVDLQMPPKSKLTDDEIEALEKWVKHGAPWPDDGSEATAKVRKGFDLEKRRAEHWAWQPVQKASPPKVMTTAWARTPVDQFILAKLEAANLQPANRADRRTLARRLYLVLTGLPPTNEEVAAFEADQSKDACANLVDRLLASPRYGERWARHWLDVVRYSETLGHEFDYVMPNAWRYRDYLIRAINQDLPYDEFIREHVAGDLIDEPRLEPNSGQNESAAATAFYWFGQQVHSPVDVKAYQLEIIDNQIDTLSRGFQALTVSCARCHDHKFDAISTKDFYALYGVMESSRYAQVDLRSKDEKQKTIAELKNLRAEVQTRGADGRQLADAPSSAPPDSPGRHGTVTTNDWFFEGLAFADPMVQPGDLLYTRATNPVEIARSPLVSSRKLSILLQGSLHSNTFVITNRFLHLYVAGKGSRANVVIENFQVIRAPIYGGVKKWINKPEFHWVTFDLEMWKGRRAYLELLDQSTPDIGDALSGNGYPSDAWFDFVEVVASDESSPPKRQTPVESVHLDAEAVAALKRVAAARVVGPVLIPGLTDSEGIDEHVFIRGGANNHGDLVQRRYLEALGGLEKEIKAGSGRMTIAEMIASPDNPLTARVWVNRVWHHLFGRGIVPTVDDFGLLGDDPSHPELLDWLANWFVTEGDWSTKNLIKMLVSTSTWQQSAIASNATYDELDPENVLLHKWSVRRLEGEAIRDNILAVSGRLDLDPPGKSIPVHLTAFLTGRGRPGKSGPLDGDGKRSIYQEMRRNFMPPMMLAFDTPQTAQTFGRRARSNVPAQALILLNDPFVHQQAGLFAERMLKNENLNTTKSQVGWLYETALQREPSDQELGAATEFVAGAEPDQKQAWTDLCHVLFNTKEFVFVN